MNLFIIGNGFDLNEGIGTGYLDFKKYLEEKNPKLVLDLEFFYRSIFNFGKDSEENVIDFDVTDIVDSEGKSILPEDCNLWSKFEKNIANLSFSTIKNELGFGRFPIQNYQEQLDTLAKYFQDTISNLRFNMKEWIKTINIYPSLFKKKFVGDNLFVNFNYTSSLENRYSVPKEKICYLHNSCEGDKDIVFGCSNNDIDDFKKYRFDSTNNFEFVNCLNDMLRKNVKDTSSIINKKLAPFLDGKKFENIIVLGSSLSEVDMPYFDYIRANNPNAKWLISYYSDYQEKVLLLNRKKWEAELNLLDKILVKFTLDADE